MRAEKARFVPNVREFAGSVPGTAPEREASLLS